MKPTLLLTFLLSFLLFGCKPGSNSSGPVKNIDMNKAFDLKQSVKLSDLVKSVEIVQFYPPEDTYFTNARSFAVGKKYIMISDDGGGGINHIILCERSGKFVTTIGRTGKGPGEFLNAWLTIMDPSENFIFIADDRSNKLIKYSVSGAFIKERKMEELPGRNIFDKAHFINDHEFVLVPRRPTRGVDGFASLVVYDLDLKPTGKIFPRANDKYLPLFNNSYQTMGEGKDRIFYWEPYFDTLYTINPDHSTKPTHVIGWSKNGPSFDYMSTFTYNLPPDQQYPVNFIYSITETEKYLFIGGISHGARFSAGYNKKSEEIFLLADVVECDTASSGKNATIQNDLFGIDAVQIQSFEKQANRYAAWMRLGWIASDFDKNCIKNREVKLPAVREQLLKIAASPDVDNNMVLLLMEAK